MSFNNKAYLGFLEDKKDPVRHSFEHKVSSLPTILGCFTLEEKSNKLKESQNVCVKNDNTQRGKQPATEQKVPFEGGVDHSRPPDESAASRRRQGGTWRPRRRPDVFSKCWCRPSAFDNCLSGIENNRKWNVSCCLSLTASVAASTRRRKKSSV